MQKHLLKIFKIYCWDEHILEVNWIYKMFSSFKHKVLQKKNVCLYVGVLVLK